MNKFKKTNSVHRTRDSQYCLTQSMAIKIKVSHVRALKTLPTHYIKGRPQCKLPLLFWFNTEKNPDGQKSPLLLASRGSRAEIG